MGLLDEVRALRVPEPGVAFVDGSGRRWDTVMANTSGKGRQTMTSEYEIMRGDLVRLLYDATKDDVRYVFGATVDDFEQNGDRVLTRFSDGTSEEYDLLIGADGQGSRIRAAIQPEGGPDPYRPVGIHMAYWFIPREGTDSDLRETYNAPGRRIIMRRSHSATETQVYFQLWDESAEARAVHRRPIETQKRFWSDRFHDAGWQTDRFLDGMQNAEFFYSQEVAQIRTATWSHGRVTLVGDAGYCPSPFSGMGTSAGLVGAYVLAGELTRNPGNINAALTTYQATLSPFVEECQSEVNPKLLRIGFPQGKPGIYALRTMGRLASFFRIPELAARFAKQDRGGTRPLPDYPELSESAGRTRAPLSSS